ncbi:hypothetical protein FAIPA1_70129 [Frankia sp. AiPs1]
MGTGPFDLGHARPGRRGEAIGPPIEGPAPAGPGRIAARRSARPGSGPSRVGGG